MSWLIFAIALANAQPVVVVGSKVFTENYILAEIASQQVEAKAKVIKRLGIGGTGLAIKALTSGAIDFYPEYTGTIAEAVLKKTELTDFAAIQQELATQGLIMSDPLGFNNTYGIAVTDEFAKRWQLNSLSDIKKIKINLRFGLSPEFYARADGYSRIKENLNLTTHSPPKVISHPLAYRALLAGEFDLIDVYSTDAQLQRPGLRVLIDDQKIFPRYQAVFLARMDFVKRCPACWNAIGELRGRIDEHTMINLNAQSDIQHADYAQVAARWLGKKYSHAGNKNLDIAALEKRIREHIQLVLLTVLFSAIVGIPLGFVVHHHRSTGHVIMILSGLVQTIPSLALLCMLIPLFGVGERSALVALCLYGLLPVVLNTYVGLEAIAPTHLETGRALGLTALQRLWFIELPLASRNIWAGLKTSTIITIGTATLAALIGAGGLGVPIIEGLAMNDMNIVLAGAIPSAALALLANFSFDTLERVVIPKGLRLK
jgi:osmoprotectant transport system permease protein